jgi:hypothetical protein
MALLTVAELGQTAFDITDNLTGADISLTDSYPNDERTVFVLKNGGGVTCNLTITKTRDTADKFGFGSLGVDNITAAVAAGDTYVVRVPVASHGDAAGRVTVSYDQVATVTVGALRLARH